VLRFDDTLYFANAAFFESQVLDELARQPQTRYLLVVANGINQMDASGDEAVRHLVEGCVPAASRCTSAASRNRCWT